MVTNVLGQKSDLKKPSCEILVWPLTLKNPRPGDPGMVTARPSQHPECRCPLSIKTSPYWWTPDAGIRIVAFRIAANTMAWTGRGWIQLFNVEHRHQEKKTKFGPFCSAPSYAVIQKATAISASYLHSLLLAVWWGLGIHHLGWGDISYMNLARGDHSVVDRTHPFVMCLGEVAGHHTSVI